MSDPLALLIAFAYVSLVLGVSEVLRRGFKLSVDLTRKFVHIAVGMIAFPLVLLFQAWQFAIIPPLVFIGVNYVSYRRQIFSGMETGERGQLGTVYFPISFSILIPLLWSSPALLVASLMPMTWGDAFAALIGQRFGARKFAILGQTRSLEGTLAMLVFSWLAVFLTLIFFAQPAAPSFIIALVVALSASIVEALSPFGMDNLTVPLSSALVLVVSQALV
ncbi:MAG: phosphatidate cytidylyltransferase [Chloroflexi bacterium]|nr:phosphatidate cytidylyltransferase [Chloroflexota bacterium]